MHLPRDTPSPERSDDSSDEEVWIDSWIDAKLVAFLKMHYNIPDKEIDNLVPNVTELMEEVGCENDERFVASAVYAAVNRKTMDEADKMKKKVENYVWVAAVLVDWRGRNNDAIIGDLQMLG
jgi:hypothetical protein